MSDELMEAMAELLIRLVTLADRDQEFRGDLHRLAGAILSATEPMAPAEADGEAARPEVAPTVEDGERRTPPRRPEPVVEELRELTFNQAPPTPDPTPTTTAWAGKVPTLDADLPAIEANCRLKADGARWVITRSRRIAAGADFRTEVAPGDREIIARSYELPTGNCQLWMCSPDYAIPEDLDLLEDLALGYEVLADAVALAREMIGDLEAHRAFFEPTLDLTAEAQASLRATVERAGGPRDRDQYRAYEWLRGTAQREHIYIKRFMRLDDPADPARLSGLSDRIERLDSRFDEGRKQVKQKKSRISRLRYHSRLIRDGGTGDYDWRKVLEAVSELVDDGVPPSNIEIREALLPILDQVPEFDEVPRGFDLALREADRYLENLPEPAEPPAPPAPIPEVAEVADLVRGRDLVLIGGQRRPGAAEALRQAFDLRELVWITTRAHQSIESFEPIVARPEVATVLLAIRWSSHSFSDVKIFCDRYGKPLVRLPTGYNPNQVALQILLQCSGQLAGG